MPTQPWSAVTNQWTLNGLYGQFIDRNVVRSLVGAANDQEKDAIVTSRMQRMTRFYRQKLLDRFQKDYPNTAQQMLTLTTERMDRSREYIGRLQEVLGVNDVQGIITELSPILTAQAQPITAPYLPIVADYLTLDNPKPPFPISGPPTSSTLQNVAKNGDFVTDITNDVLYVNRGSSASPNWIQWNTQSLIDYLLNPTELLDCGYIRTSFYIQGYASLMDNGDLEFRMTKMPVIAGITMKEALEAEALAFGIINVDLSADGVLSDFEESMGEVSNWVF